jgi:activator of 2-hydroxyglutaryl-CoA dehydratase
MLTKNGLLPPLFFSGGVSQNPSLRRFLEMELDMPVLWDPCSQFAGALGAARIGLEEKTNHGNRG